MVFRIPNMWRTISSHSSQGPVFYQNVSESLQRRSTALFFQDYRSFGRSRGFHSGRVFQALPEHGKNMLTMAKRYLHGMATVDDFHTLSEHEKHVQIEKVVRFGGLEEIQKLVKWTELQGPEEQRWQRVIKDTLIHVGNREQFIKVLPLLKATPISDIKVFYRIIDEDDLKCFKTLHEVGLFPKEFDHNGPDLLLYALWKGKLDFVEYFVKDTHYDVNGSYRFDPNWAHGLSVLAHPTETHITPAYLAAVMKDAEKLSCLVKLGADLRKPNTPNFSQHPFNWKKSLTHNHKYSTPLEAATVYGSPECVEMILNKDPDLVNQLNAGGVCLLNLAILKDGYGDDAPMTRLLLEKGANPNVEANNDECPSALLFCVAEGRLEPAKELLSAGVKTNVTTRDGKNLWHIAASSLSRLDFVKEIPGLVRINDKDSRGKTPLMLAIDNCNPETVEALINIGADVEILFTTDSGDVIDIFAYVDGIEKRLISGIKDKFLRINSFEKPEYLFSITQKVESLNRIKDLLKMGQA